MGETMRTYEGGCHCGAIRFEVDAPESLEVYDWNCSICRKCGYLHLNVQRSRFRLLWDESALTRYQFNTGVAEHLFCSVCGIKSFYVPRSHPDGYSVNVRCLDSFPSSQIEIIPFDGADWEAHIAELPPLEGQ